MFIINIILIIAIISSIIILIRILAINSNFVFEILNVDKSAISYENGEIINYFVIGLKSLSLFLLVIFVLFMFLLNSK